MFEGLDKTTRGLMDLMMEVYKIKPKTVDNSWHQKCLEVCEVLLKQNPLVAEVKIVTWDDVQNMEKKDG